MAFGDYELIHTKRVNRERTGRDVYDYRLFQAKGGYTPYFFAFSFAAIVQQLSGTELKSVIPCRSILSKAGFQQYLKVGGLYILLPAFVGYCVGVSYAADHVAYKNLIRHSLIYRPEMEEYKKEIYYS